jgi:hypothetical protein
MARTSYSNLGYMGHGFQMKLMAQILTDRKFGGNLMPVFKSKFIHGNNHLKMLANIVKNYWEKYDSIPRIDTLEEVVRDEITKEIDREHLLDIIVQIKEVDLGDYLHVQTKASRFCKQQELKEASMKIKKIADDGNVDRYDECEEILRDALKVTDLDSGYTDVFEGMDDVLSDDFRDPMSLGMGERLDNDLGGGGSKGELIIVLAPTGVGKTTSATRMANTMYNAGKNVVQIFMEDPTKVIQRKHFACWTGIPINDLSDHKEQVKATLITNKERSNHLILMKMGSFGTTIPRIRQALYKLKADGIHPDVVILDYIDCVAATKEYDSDYGGEGDTMRQFETLISEADLNVLGITFVQGNRSSISADVVDTDQMGGSIKKAQIGHILISIARTKDQKEDKLATMTLLKSRVGDDGLIYEDILFDNSRVLIDTSANGSSMTTPVGFIKKKEEKKKTRIADVVSNAQRNARAIVNKKEPEANQL